jgi:NAD(P)-dependent dehydrogenase (short-subunit alcohol dehydrogenase family)
MDLQLDRQVGIVFGGASGIGLAIVQQMLAEGMRVVVSDLSNDGVAVANGLSPSGDCRGHVADITDEQDVRSVVQQTIDAWGGLQHVVVAAGAGSGKFGFPFWNLKPADWRRVLDVNILGSAIVADAVQGPLRENAPGTLLLFASVAGQIGSQTDPPYSAAKAAVINFAQCAAKDLAPYDVRVNAIAPGMVQTPLNRAVWKSWHDQTPEEERLDYDAWAAEKIDKIAPLARWQTAEDVANAAVFLMSPRAKNITGQTVNVDGGQVMHA